MAKDETPFQRHLRRVYEDMAGAKYVPPPDCPEVRAALEPCMFCGEARATHGLSLVFGLMNKCGGFTGKDNTRMVD